MDLIFKELQEAAKKSHSPYSNFPVSCCLKTKDSPTLFTGANIENASYGATMCAERVAIFNTITELGSKFSAEWLAFLTPTDKPSRPCGLCLQVMSEFLDPQTPIHCFAKTGEKQTFQLKELLPEPFNDLL